MDDWITNRQRIYISIVGFLCLIICALILLFARGEWWLIVLYILGFFGIHFAPAFMLNFIPEISYEGPSEEITPDSNEEQEPPLLSPEVVIVNRFELLDIG